jgi:hypothetical protein
MMHGNDWDQVSSEAQRAIMEGALAYHALKHEHHDYQHWVKVGRAIVELRRAAAAQAGVSPNSLKHPAYRAAYKRLIGSEQAGELGEIDSATMTHAAWLANNLANVNDWRAILDDRARIALNHPTSIWRKHPDGRKAERVDKVRDGVDRQNVARDLSAAAERINEAADRIEIRTGERGIELDLKDEAGRRASWETLVGVYGFGPLIELFLEGLWVCERADLAPHLEDLLTALQQNFDDDFEMTALIEGNREKWDEEEEPKTEALDQIEEQHGEGKMWVTAKWLREADISEETIEELVSEGKLRRGRGGAVQTPDQPQEVPAWCRTGKKAARVEALRQALEAAGTAGLHKDDIHSYKLGDAASDRGIDALVGLIGSAKAAVEIDERVYLARFAPGATPDSDEPAADERDTHDTSPLAPEEPEPAPTNPLEAALRKAGGKGMSAFELMQATGLDMLGLPAALAPLREIGSVLERDGRYYHAAEEAGR